MIRLTPLILTLLLLPLAPVGAQSAASAPPDVTVITGAASQDALTAFAARVGGGGRGGLYPPRQRLGHLPYSENSSEHTTRSLRAEH